MKETRPFIFVSNDDGYNAAGINTLIKVAMEYGDVLVAAPLNHQSGKASSITTYDPLRAIKKEEREGLQSYAVMGTPSDCAKLGLGVLTAGRKVDLVLSGINHGLNHGNSVLYSGTLGVVFEGVMAGIPSIAFSFDNYSPDAEFDSCIPVLRHVIGKVMNEGMPHGICLNVNIPHSEHLEGIKTAITAPGAWTNTWDHRTAPHGFDYYWMLGEYVETNPNDNRTDAYWLRRNYVTVTPVHIDQTDYESMEQVDKLLQGF